MKPSNYVVMPVFNCLALTQIAVESVFAQDISGGVQLLVIDGGSTDGTAEWLRAQADVQVFALGKHEGVSRAWNIALGHVFAPWPEGMNRPYALVVNNDVRLRPDAYQRLVDDGGLFVTCVGTSSGAQFPGGEPSGERRPHPDFSTFLIRRECWQRVGEFDETMRIYASDGDYHLRMTRAGIVAYCLDLPFYHYASGTLKTVDEADGVRILDQAQKDRETFARKWGCEMGSGDYYRLFEPAPAMADAPTAAETAG